MCDLDGGASEKLTAADGLMNFVRTRALLRFGPGVSARSMRGVDVVAICAVVEAGAHVEQGRWWE